MAREGRGAAAIALPSAGQGGEARRPPPHYFMRNERSRRQAPTTVGDLSTSISAPYWCKMYAEAHVASGVAPVSPRNVPVAVDRCHVAASSMGTDFLKRSATAATILAGGAGLARMGAFGAPSRSA